MENLLTVIVQTSPLPSHPSTALLEALFRSFDRVKHLKDCNIIILCDGACDEDDKDVKDTKQSKKINYKHGSINQDKVNDYLLHLDLLQQKIDNKEAPFISTNNGTIKLLKLPYRHGSARAIKAAFPINTPYVLIAQHDNFFVHDVNYLKDMLKFLDEEEETKSWLQSIHFVSTATLNKYNNMIILTDAFIIKNRDMHGVSPVCNNKVIFTNDGIEKEKVILAY